VSPERIPLAAPEITEEDTEAVLQVLRTTQLSRGPAESRFEAAVCEAVGVRHAVAVSSGTSGLHLGLRALSIGAGDEVITTPYSFVASSNALLYEGSVPVFVDIDPDTFNIDPGRIEAVITSRTRAVLPVHVYGRPAAMPELRRIADRNDLHVVEDACEAVGSRVGGRAAGAWGDVGVLSFYPNKQVTTGEGGVITTDDDAIAGRLRLLRNQGRRPTPSGFDQFELGYSVRLPEMSCALGAAQMGRLDAIVERRRQIASAYRERLNDLPALRTPPRGAADDTISWFVFVVVLAPGHTATDRDALMAGLAADGIATARYFLPIHLQPMYRERFGYRGGEFPIAESVGDRALALPFFHGITLDQIDRICESLRARLR
jgi:perosamine synthetase